MPINLPDIVQHNNQLNAIVDSNFVRGGTRSVANLTELYQIGSGVNSKLDQLKEGVTRVYVSGENKFYLLKNINNRTTSAGWQPENYVYTTGTQTISGSKTFTDLIAANQMNMFDIDLFQVSGVNLEIYDGNVEFKLRPTVNGSGVQLKGEIVDTPVPPSLIFDGTRTIKRGSFPSGLSVGGSDALGFLNNVFFPPQPISISLKATPLYTFGQQTRIVFDGSINANDYSDAILGTLIYTDLSNGQTIFTNTAPEFGSFYQTGYDVSSNRSLKVELTYAKNGTEFKAIQNSNMVFESPMYFLTGIDTLNFNDVMYVNSDVNQGLRAGITSRLESKSDKTIIYNTNNQIMYAMFPSTWGPVTSIKDKNNLENLGGWSSYSWSYYNVLKFNYLTSVSNFSLTFKF